MIQTVSVCVMLWRADFVNDAILEAQTVDEVHFAKLLLM